PLRRDAHLQRGGPGAGPADGRAGGGAGMCHQPGRVDHPLSPRGARGRRTRRLPLGPGAQPGTAPSAAVQEAFLILPDRSSFAASAGLQQWRVARPESSKGLGAATPFADSGRATRPYGNHDLPSLLPALAIRRTQTILENTTRPISGEFIAE